VTLTVDTATRAFSLSLYQGEELAHIVLRRELAHSQQVVRVCEFMLERLELKIGEIDAAYADLGPGSFTGIRIGLSFVNTLSQILNIPLLGIPSLDLLAFGPGMWYNSAVCFVRSRRHEVYTAYYVEGERKTDYLALGGEDFHAFLGEHEPKHVVAPEEDFRELGEIGGMPGEVHHAFPSSRSLYHVARVRGLEARRGYLKPIYVRGI
jgi:tRNA threonylcarbamoyl adenosine modification protein YeaZ